MKTAFLLGHNYEGSPYQLPDCILDVENMQTMYTVAGIKTMTDTVMTPNLLKERIQTILRKSNKPSDQIFFFYSGHGTQIKGSESDGFDEAICLWDGEVIHCVTDDALAQMFAGYKGKLIMIFDSCFSGGMERSLKQGTPKTITWNEVSMIKYEPAHVRAIPIEIRKYIISACAEGETAQSTGNGGLFTNALIESFNAGWRSIKKAMPYCVRKCAGTQTPAIKLSSTKLSQNQYLLP